jgi:hypothetical protein
MLITTIGALVYSAVSYFQESKFVLGGIAVILIILAIVIANEAGWFIGGRFKSRLHDQFET